MSKNKKLKNKKNKKQVLILDEKATIEGTEYFGLYNDLSDMSYRLCLVDQEYLKCLKKKDKKKFSKVELNEKRKSARKKILAEMEGKSIFDKIINFTTQSIIPAIVTICKLVKQVIHRLCCIEGFNEGVNPNTMKKIGMAYNIATAVAI